MFYAAVASQPGLGRTKRILLLATLSSLAIAQAPQLAEAAPPPNDAPTSPAGFTTYTAENGRPSDLQAVAELREATPDQGVPRCLGPASFARTAWYGIPPSDQPQEISVEASGETLDVVDLAAFVQPLNATQTTQPNVCDGAGAGGASASQEPTAGVSLRIPAGRAVLIQVGRRGTPGTDANERVILSLDDRIITAPAFPTVGDYANSIAPGVESEAETQVPLFGATLSEDDPAEPPCPALGSVWRRINPQRKKPFLPRLITVDGNDATTIALFGSPAPTADNALDCVNRSGRGSLRMLLPKAAARKQLWLRIGTDAPVEESTATLRTRPATGAYVADGGPGGFDPTPGGPGGGFPADCAEADASRASITGTTFRGNVRRLNRRRYLTIPFKLDGGPLCDVELRLRGPKSRTYATRQIIRVRSGRQFIRLRRPRGSELRRGAYRLEVSALSRTGEHVRVRGTLRARLA